MIGPNERYYGSANLCSPQERDERGIRAALAFTGQTQWGGPPPSELMPITNVSLRLVAHSDKVADILGHIIGWN